MNDCEFWILLSGVIFADIWVGFMIYRGVKRLREMSGHREDG